MVQISTHQTKFTIVTKLMRKLAKMVVIQSQEEYNLII